MIWACGSLAQYIWQQCPYHGRSMQRCDFDKFWFFLLLSRLLTRSWQVSGQTLVEGIWLVVVSQSRWFLNCNHSRVITMIIIAIAVSQTRLRYNVDNVDGRQWLPMSCTSLGQVFDRCLPGTCQVLARYLALPSWHVQLYKCNHQADWSGAKAEQELAKS